MTDENPETTWVEDGAGCFSVAFVQSEIASLDGALLVHGQLSSRLQREISIPWGRQLCDRKAALTQIHTALAVIDARVNGACSERDRVLLAELLIQLEPFAITEGS